MKRGFPLHLKVTLFPSGISESLISILARAKTSAEALMLERNWVTTALALYTAAIEVPAKQKLIFSIVATDF